MVFKQAARWFSISLVLRALSFTINKPVPLKESAMLLYNNNIHYRNQIA
jgi:hypothetical protein